MAYFKNPNLQKLINELERYPSDDNELLKILNEPSNKASNSNNISEEPSSDDSRMMKNIGGGDGAMPVRQAAIIPAQNISIAESAQNTKSEVTSATTHPSIPMLPSKETLDYARRISEKLVHPNINTDGPSPQDIQFTEQLLSLSSNVPGVRRNHTNYSSIGSGNLASESGTSHIHSPGTDHDETIDTSQISVPPPRNKNRPKSQLYLSDEMEYDENVLEPPSITLHDVDRQETRVMMTGKRQDNDEVDAKTNTYLQRPVPEEPVGLSNNPPSVKSDTNPLFAHGQQNNDINPPLAHEQQNNDIDSNIAHQQQNINTLSQLVSITNDTTVASEFDQLEIPKDERILLEQFIDALSRLTADLLLDPSRRLESLRRLRSAARALEGF
ncbi:hypothetical protein MOSE0_F05468 [Monosporozyma servazzii]